MRLYRALKGGRITYDESKRRLLFLWQSTGGANIARFNQIFSGLPLDPAAEPIISALRAEGLEIAIITGSMDLYCEIVAARLGVQHWFANTRLIFDESGNLTDFHYHLQQAALKLRQLKAWSATLGLRSGEIAVVGDGENDSDLFAHTGAGILVAREHHDPATAKKAKWIVNALPEVLPIIRQRLA
jgi:phosphoserine phosphatase